MIKKPTKRFVDMCIDIDANILSKDNSVINRIYTEMVQVAFMLILKKHYFNKAYYNE